jgi:hypothetical protein
MWQLADVQMGGAVLRPFVQIRLLSDDDLASSQSAPMMYGLHNPDAGLPCVSCKGFAAFGELAQVLDRKIKTDHEAVIKCHNCQSIHVLTTKGALPGWVTLARPL